MVKIFPSWLIIGISERLAAKVGDVFSHKIKTVEIDKKLAMKGDLELIGREP